MYSLHKVSSMYRLGPWSWVIVNIPLVSAGSVNFVNIGSKYSQ